MAPHRPPGRNRFQRLSAGRKVLAIAGAVAGAFVVLGLIVNAVDPSPASNNSAASSSGGTSAVALPSATAPVTTSAPAPSAAVSSASAVSSATATASPSPHVTTTAPKKVPPATTPATHAAPATAAAPSCHPLTSGGNCYKVGQLCRKSDHGVHGVASDGEAIVCEDNNGWRWEPA